MEGGIFSQSLSVSCTFDHRELFFWSWRTVVLIMGPAPLIMEGFIDHWDCSFDHGGFLWSLGLLLWSWSVILIMWLLLWSWRVLLIMGLIWSWRVLLIMGLLLWSWSVLLIMEGCSFDCGGFFLSCGCSFDDIGLFLSSWRTSFDHEALFLWSTSIAPLIVNRCAFDHGALLLWSWRTSFDHGALFLWHWKVTISLFDGALLLWSMRVLPFRQIERFLWSVFWRRNNISHKGRFSWSLYWEELIKCIDT